VQILSSIYVNAVAAEFLTYSLRAMSLSCTKDELVTVFDESPFPLSRRRGIYCTLSLTDERRRKRRFRALERVPLNKTHAN